MLLLSHETTCLFLSHDECTNVDRQDADSQNCVQALNMETHGPTAEAEPEHGIMCERTHA